MPEITLGSLLRDKRLASEDPRTGEPYTQDRLAELLGVGRGSTISSWERGATKGLKVEHVNRLAELLPVTVAELCRSIGYEVEDQALTQDERRLLAAFRRLRAVPILQQGALASLEGMHGAFSPQSERPTRVRRRAS